MEQEAALLGLHFNHYKTELICGGLAGGQLLQVAPDLCKVDPKDAVLLGSPIGQSASIDAAITSRVEALKFMGQRLTHFRKHDALILLRHSFAIPRILYILRTAPCFSFPCLESFDRELRSIVGAVLNISLEEDSAWSQAMLPVGSGGIGVRRAVQLAPSAFLALLLAVMTSSIGFSLTGYRVTLTLRLWKPVWNRAEVMTSHLRPPWTTHGKRPGTNHRCRLLIRPCWRLPQTHKHGPDFLPLPPRNQVPG